MKDRLPAIDAHAYVDECLPPEERRSFEARLNLDEELRRKTGLWQVQNEAIRAAFNAPGRGPRAKGPHPWLANANLAQSEIDVPALRLFAKSASSPASGAERAAPKWMSVLRRPITRAAVVLIGVTLFPGAMEPSPQDALAQTGAAAFRAFAFSPAAGLDFRGGSTDDLSSALGPEFQAAGLTEWATPLGWTLRGAKRVPGLSGTAVFLVLERPEGPPTGILVEPLDAPASSAVRIESRGGMTVAAFTRDGFGIAVAASTETEVEAWLYAAGF